MSKKMLGRRAAMKRALVVIGSAALVPLVHACGGEEALSCDNTSGMTPGDVATRTGNAYVDTSTIADKNCLNCQFYAAGAANQCGTCTVVKGPIHPQGYCNLWAAIQA